LDKNFGNGLILIFIKNKKTKPYLFYYNNNRVNWLPRLLISIIIGLLVC